MWWKTVDGQTDLLARIIQFDRQRFFITLVFQRIGLHALNQLIKGATAGEKDRQFDFKGIKHGQALDGIEGDTAFDEERIEPMKFDDEDASDYSDNEMISFKEVN